MSDRYEVRRKIGQGGLGTVYQAYDTHLKRDVAIKRLYSPMDPAGNVDRQATVGKLMKEATTLSTLNHQNIVSVFDVGVDEDGGYVVMELLDGETLGDTISKATLTLDDFHLVVVQTLEALIAAEAANMLHRDLKPSNIMVIWLPSGRFLIKILDFGLAKISEQPAQQTLDQNNSVLGSIFYMAPEQFERRELNYSTDLYSMGCIYYFCLTGRDPFTGDSAAEVMNAHLDHRVTPLHELRPDLPSAVCDWVMWLLRREMGTRPQSAREALDHFPLTEAASGGVELAPDRDFSIPSSPAAPPSTPPSNASPVTRGGAIPTRTTSARIPATRQTTGPTRTTSSARVASPATSTVRTAPARKTTLTGTQPTALDESPSRLPLLLGIGGTILAVAILVLFLAGGDSGPGAGAEDDVAAKTGSSKSGGGSGDATVKITPVPLVKLQVGDEIRYSFTSRRRSSDLLRFALLHRDPSQAHVYDGYAFDLRDEGDVTLAIRRYDDHPATQVLQLLPLDSTSLRVQRQGVNVPVSQLVKAQVSANVISPDELRFTVTLWRSSGAKTIYTAKDTEAVLEAIGEYGFRGQPEIVSRLSDQHLAVIKDPSKAFAGADSQPASPPLTVFVEDDFDTGSDPTKTKDPDDPSDTRWTGPGRLLVPEEEPGNLVNGTNALFIPPGKQAFTPFGRVDLETGGGELEVDFDINAIGPVGGLRLLLAERVNPTTGYLIEIKSGMRILIYRARELRNGAFNIGDATRLHEVEPPTAKPPRNLRTAKHVRLSLTRDGTGACEIEVAVTNRQLKVDEAGFRDTDPPSSAFTRLGIRSVGRRGRLLLDNVRIRTNSTTNAKPR